MTDAERRAFWRKRVAAYHESGLTVAEWCRRNDVREGQMRRWIKRIAEESEPARAQAREPRWLVVDVEDKTARAASQGGTITLRIGNVSVDVRPDFDADLLCRVIQVLNATC